MKKNEKESAKSLFNFLVWLPSRNTKENQSVPSWSEFKELVPDLEQGECWVPTTFTVSTN